MTTYTPEKHKIRISKETPEHKEIRLAKQRVAWAKNKAKLNPIRNERLKNNKTHEEIARVEEKKRIKEQKEIEYQEAMKQREIKTEKQITRCSLKNKNYMKKLYNDFFIMYGDRCSLCGESVRGFLTLDHINNDANGRRSKEEYRRAVKEYKPDEFQVLCYNCNECKNNDNQRKDGSYSDKYTKQIRSKFREMYGGKCACCGESEPKNLTLDHIKNNGKELRKKNGTGLAEHRVAVKNYDPETYQVLCWNCNIGKHRNKNTCPHLQKD